MSYRVIIALGVSLLFIQGIVLFFFGQPLICTCDSIKLWVGEVLSSDNSQHLTDWYTFSHIIHGFLFYALLWLFVPRMSLGYRLLIAMGIEITWEIVENTPWVINAYREQALAQGYMGDSIINSLFDTLWMVVGFIAAWCLPIWVTVFIGLAFEVWVGYMIHDNLVLNILNFIYPLEFIHQWQSGS